MFEKIMTIIAFLILVVMLCISLFYVIRAITGNSSDVCVFPDLETQNELLYRGFYAENKD